MLPEGPKEDAVMGHMAQSVCAAALAKAGKIKVHNSNGTICAVSGECVYMTCANSKDRITGLGCGIFEVVNKYTASSATTFRRDCIHWVAVTEGRWTMLVNVDESTPHG